MNSEIAINYWNLIRFGLEYDKSTFWKSAKGRRRISCGNYPYEIFNICFLHDMLSQILQTLYDGYIPYIDLKDRKSGWNNWDIYFEQPYSNLQEVQNLPIQQTDCRITTLWGPMYDSPFNEYEYVLTRKLYHDWVIIKENAFNYIASEYKSLIHGRKVLGVLCRGTDFTTWKPAGHPVQPPLSIVIDDVRKNMTNSNCDYIYIASESQKIVETFQKEFPGKILTNNRHYYDKEYYDLCAVNKKKIWIADLFKDDYGQNYARGLEYLSSLVLLSSCNGLIAGNCGGSEAALYFNDNRYAFYKLYNLGLY